MSDKLLEEPRQEWIVNHLEHWGAWAFSGLDFENRMNMLAKLMMEADPNLISVPVREMCDDELGLVISSVVGYYVKNPSLQDYRYLEAKYVYGCSVYAIAKYHWQKERNNKKILKKRSFRTWQRNVASSLQASEWMIAKFLEPALKNHKNADKLRKYAFNV